MKQREKANTLVINETSFNFHLFSALECLNFRQNENGLWLRGVVFWGVFPCWSLNLVPSASADPAGGDAIAHQVDVLLGKMTLEEKIGQMVLFTDYATITGPSGNLENLEDEIARADCGNVFNAHTTARIRHLQQIAVEKTRLKIPLLFGYDVIHGYKTIFPIPLAMASSWDTNVEETAARIAATEASAGGLNWTFAPMVDIARDPRWGRISEGAGEDTFLGCRMAEAQVRGFQGAGLGDLSGVLACVKHFAAYGAVQATAAITTPWTCLNCTLREDLFSRRTKRRSMPAR